MHPTRQSLSKKPQSKTHWNKSSKQCEICDKKLNLLLYKFQARGCANCGKSGCKQCVKYSRRFDNGDHENVCKNCKDLPKEMINVYVKNVSKSAAKNKKDQKIIPIMEEIDEGDRKVEHEEFQRAEKNVEGPPEKASGLVPVQNDRKLSTKIGELNNEISRLRQEAKGEKRHAETAKHNEKMALSRFKEISAENSKLKGELKRSKMTRSNSFNSSSQLLTRLDEIQMISEGRDEDLVKVGKQMDELVQKLQISEAQKHKALEELQTVQATQIEQLEQIVGRLSTQKNRTLEIKHNLQNAVDERDYHKQNAKLKEEEINTLMAENEKLRQILQESDSSSTSNSESFEGENSTEETLTIEDNTTQVPIKLILDLNGKSPPSKHAEAQENLPENVSESVEEDWEVERRKMQSAMENLRHIIHKWKASGVVVQQEVVS